jgi:hypothetical protein
MRALDHLDRAEARGPSRRSHVDWRGRISLVLAVLVMVGIVIAVPGIAPPSLRRLAGLDARPPSSLAAPSGSGSFAFMAHQPGNPAQPVTYDRCRWIRWVVNPAGGPPDSIALVQDAVARVEEASGLRFQYAGKTTERPHWDSPVTPAIGPAEPVLVSWAKADEVHQLAGNVAGIGGSVSISTPDGRLRYVTGGVTLDAGSFARLTAQLHGEAEERAIILHELGHVVGLAHVSDTGELMSAKNAGRLDFGPGDLEGLAKLGSGPCF